MAPLQRIPQALGGTDGLMGHRHGGSEPPMGQLVV